MTSASKRVAQKPLALLACVALAACSLNPFADVATAPDAGPSCTLVYEDAIEAALAGFEDNLDLTPDQLAIAIRVFNEEPGDQIEDGQVDGAVIRYGIDDVPPVLVFVKGECVVEYWKLSPEEWRQITGRNT